MSLRTRFSLAYLALLALCLSAFGVGVYTFLDSKLHSAFEDSVRTQGRQFVPLLSALTTKDSIESSMRLIRSEPSTFIVVEAKGYNEPASGIVYKSPTLIGLDLPRVPIDRVVNVTGDPQLGDLVVYAQGFQSVKYTGPPPRNLGEPPPRRQPLFTGQLTIARSLSDLNASLRLLRFILFAGGLAVLAVATLLGMGVSTTLLRPLARLRSTAQRIGDERDFSRRMPVPNTRDEVGRLAVSFNQMLTELERSHGDLQAALDGQRRFVADASHELRTPLTAIRTNIEFLKRVPDAREDDRQAALRDVLTEMRRIEELVADLLALARLESTRPARRSVRLDHILRDLHRDAVRQAPPAIEVTLGPLPAVWVSGDREDLRRGVWNLIENALKYTSGGTVALGLRVEQGQALVEVADTGMGIAPLDQPFVFDRFWRAQGVRGSTGSGLGLAITKWVAQSHGGTVTVRSALGEGSTFVLALPTISGPVLRRPGTAAPRTPAAAGTSGSRASDS